MTENEYKQLLDCSDKAVQDTIDNITSICNTLPKREPGSKGEAIAAKHMQKQLSDLGAYKTDNEKFKVHPGAFYGWIYFSISFALASCILNFFLPVVSIILVVLALVFVSLEFGIYAQFIDPLFPTKESQNVVAYFKPKKKIKRRIVFDGHIDATWPWPINEKFGGTVYHLTIIVALLGVLYMLAVAIYGTIIGKGGLYILSPAYNLPLFITACIQLFFLPFLISMYWMWDRNKIVDGANDNLTGCCLPISIIKTLRRKNIQLENTELVVVLSGCEEVGLRGAKAFVKKHKNDFKDVETKFICLDCLHNPQKLQVGYKDLNSFVKLDKETCDMFYQSGKNVGIDVIKSKLPLLGGATNAAAYQKGKFKACSVWALSNNLDGFYHTTKDKPNRLNRTCLEKVYRILIDVIKTVDNK